MASVQVLRRLERLVEEEKSPSEDPDLSFLTSLLQLAVGCRAMLRARRFNFPAADPELLHSFYPLIMNFMLEVQMQDLSEPDGEAWATLLHAFSTPDMWTPDMCKLQMQRSCRTETGQGMNALHWLRMQCFREVSMSLEEGRLK